MSDQNEVIVVNAPVKKKRMTAEERLAKVQANINAKALNARERAKNTLARRTAKANAKKAHKAANRGVTVNALRSEIERMAANAHLSMAPSNIKIPSKGAKADHLQKYFNAAKARYYKRSKKASSFQRHVLDSALAQGINSKYIKFGRNKNIQEILKKAEGRRAKNTAKASKSEKRASILALVEQQMGLGEKEVMSLVCVRKKAEKA